MSNTYQFELPMLQASQAQKHVTVNETMARLDALAQLRFVSRSLSVPPASPVDGEAYFVASSGTGDWAGQGRPYRHFLKWRLGLSECQDRMAGMD